MKGMDPEKPPNHERWIISYADFTTLLLATFVVMYAVSTINSSKFQQMAESFSTAFIGRTTTLNDTGFGAANKGPFDFMPNPVHLPIITREVMVRSAPPALRQEETRGKPSAQPNGQFLQKGAAQTQTEEKTLAQTDVPPQAQAQAQAEADTAPQTEGQNPGDIAMRDQIAQRLAGLDKAYAQLSKSLAPLIQKGQVNVSLQSLGVVIDINEVLLFRSGKADLTPDALPLIDQIAKILTGLRYQIQVNGFTDDVPIHNAQFDSNWDLSATRAISVVKRFVAAGIDPTLLVGAGFSEYHPVAPNATSQGQAANRRVSIVVVSPLQGNDPARSPLLGSGTDRSATPQTAAPVASSAVTPAAPKGAPAQAPAH